MAAVAPPEIWIFTIFGVGHTTGFMFYIMVQFDLKYKQRNHRDWSYMLFLVALPAGIGINQRFQPKYGPLRIFYGFVLIMSIFIWQVLFFTATRYLQVPVRRYQITSTVGIIENNNRLTGSEETLALISHDERVSSILYKYQSDFIEILNFSV